MPVRFQVDPDFYDHPKAIGMSDGATALWVRAGSYSAAKLTNGFVVEAALSLLSRCPDEAARELVERGLWKRVRGGYRFHQWDHRNLTRERIEADREADRERKRAERRQSKSVLSDVQADGGGNPNGIRSLSVSVSESMSVSGRRRGRRPKPQPHPFVDDGSGQSCASCRLSPSHGSHIVDLEATA